MCDESAQKVAKARAELESLRKIKDSEVSKVAKVMEGLEKHENVST